jgi:hypothetical protein
MKRRLRALGLANTWRADEAQHKPSGIGLQLHLNTRSTHRLQVKSILHTLHIRRGKLQRRYLVNGEVLDDAFLDFAQAVVLAIQMLLGNY